MICLVPTRLNMVINRVVTTHAIGCTPPRFCSRSSEAERFGYPTHAPVLVHWDLMRDPTELQWLEHRAKQQPFVLIVPDRTAPLDYYHLHRKLPDLVILREADLSIPSVWQQLQQIMRSVGPLRSVLNQIQTVVVSQITDAGVSKLFMTFIEHAPKSEQVGHLEVSEFKVSRGTLSRDFGNLQLAEPRIVLAAVRTAILRGLVEAGMPTSSACELLHVQEASLRRSYSRTYLCKMDNVLELPWDTVRDWGCSFFNTMQPTITMDQAYAVLKNYTRSNIGRRTA